MKKKEKKITINGEKIRFIPASEFKATYNWQKTNKKDGNMIPLHIWDKYKAKKALSEKLAKKMKENWENSKKKK